MKSNPISGYHSADPRFKVRIRSLAHENMYLPVSMRTIPQMIRLLDGVSPLEVLSCASIKEARLAFDELRKKYDFPYWAALDFKVLDIANPHRIVPLRLNPLQRSLADTLIRDSTDGLPHRYIITKTIPRRGLTTCVQAFILWMQTYHPANSITCAPSEGVMDLMKANVSRYIRKDGGRYRIFLHGNRASAFFQSPYTPHVLDRVTAGFVHLADMAQWLDRSSETTHHIISNALNGWVRRVPALFILEGDRPSDPRFRMEDHRNHHIPELIRLMRLSDFCDNPLFLSKVVTACDPGVSSDYQYIDLDKAP